MSVLVFSSSTVGSGGSVATTSGVLVLNVFKKSFVFVSTDKIDFNEVAWIAIKDEVLLEALKQRFEEDVKFRKIVEAVKEQGKILLYYQTAVASELGGMLKEGKIQGDNKYGHLIMQLASFPEF